MNKVDCTICESYKAGICSNVRSIHHSKYKGIGDRCSEFWDKDYNPLDIGRNMEKEKESNAIRPNHYGKGTLSPDDFIAEQELTFREGCVVKYVVRYKNKDGLKDLMKAKEYLELMIRDYEKFNGGKNE